MDIPSVLISREAHREHWWHSNSDHNAMFFRTESFVKPKNFTGLLLNAPHNIYFSMKSTENYVLRLVVHHFVRSLLWIERHFIALFLVTTINFSFSGASYRWLYILMNPFSACDDPHPISHLEWLKVAKILNHTTSNLVFAPALYRSWFVSLASVLEMQQAKHRTDCLWRVKDCYLRGIAKLFLFRALGFSVDSWEINHLTSHHFQPWWARWITIAC